MNYKALDASLTGLLGTNAQLTIARAGKVYSSSLTYSDFDKRETWAPEAFKKKELPAEIRAPLPLLDPEDSSAISITVKTRDTDYVYSQIAKGLSLLPRRLKAAVSALIVLAPISDDLSSSYDYQGQRAYFVAAENKIHIFERYRLYSRPAVLYEDAKIGLLHEYGHALDAHAKLSASEQFQEAYTDDCDKLSSGPRQTLWYFTQAGSRGPAETFAACFAIENDPDHADDSQIARYFPRCFSVVKSIVSSYRK